MTSSPYSGLSNKDGMGIYSCGLDREVWEGETLFTAITLALWEVEVCTSAFVLPLWVNLCPFVHLCLNHCLALLLLAVCFFFHSGCFIPNIFCPFINSHLCLYLSSCVFPPLYAHHSLSAPASIGATVNKKV